MSSQHKVNTWQLRPQRLQLLSDKGLMNLSKTTGFSLIEVMVAMGLMSMIAMGYMHLTQKRTKEERTSRINTEINVFIADVRGLLSTEGSCQETFKGVRLVSKNPHPIEGIKNSIGISIFSEDYQHDQGLFKLTGLALEDIKSTIIDGNETVGKFVIRFEKLGSIFGARQVTRGLELFFSLNNDGSINNCGPLAMMGNIQNHEPEDIVSAGVSDELIEKAIKENPELEFAREMLQEMQENQKRLLIMQEKTQNDEF